jgi:hypothetical protein
VAKRREEPEGAGEGHTRVSKRITTKSMRRVLLCVLQLIGVASCGVTAAAHRMRGLASPQSGRAEPLGTQGAAAFTTYATGLARSPFGGAARSGGRRQDEGAGERAAVERLPEQHWQRQPRALASLLQQAERSRGFVAGAMGQAAAGARGSMGLGYASGRGRGRGRAKMYYGPDEFDDSWWTPPPPIGADPFMQGYSSHVYPRQQFGYGAMPHGGFGTAHHFWGGSSYQPGAHASWRGRSFSAPRSGGSPYMPYQTPRDSYGMGLYQPGMGANLPVSSPYYYTPPPLQGDWNLPKNPPPPPAAAAR